MGVSGCVVDMDRYQPCLGGPLIATSLQQLVGGPTRGGSQCIDIAVSKAVQSFSH